MKRVVLVAVVCSALIGGAGVIAQRAGATKLPAVVVYKDPNCGCCTLWGKHMEQAGFSMTYVNSPDMPGIRTKNRVPTTLQSCHTAVVDGYVVEGHVPAADVKRLLASKPKVAGIAVPGMPIGSPGMEQGSRKQSYAVMSFEAGGKTAIFAEH
jgi:hypothetical protein